MIRQIWQRITEIAREEESGQGMVEFVIVFPVQFLVIAGIMQFALVNMATLVVNHAAFKAARAALVADESPSVGSKMPKRAAAIICSAIAGTHGQRSAETMSYPGPAGGSKTLARYGVAFANTDVKIHYDAEGQAIQAIVSHKYEMVIPIVHKIFSTGNHVNGIPYRLIQEDCILPCPWRRN
jgi:hypothetical protein